MRQLNYILLLISVVLGGFACKENSADPNREDPVITPRLIGDEVTYSPRFFTKILDVKEVKISHEGDWFFLRQEGKVCAYDSKDEKEQARYQTLGDQIGDYEMKPSYMHVGPLPTTTGLGIKKIELDALSDYDETHPAGASLLDILSLDYEAFSDLTRGGGQSKTLRYAKHSINARDFQPVNTPGTKARVFLRVTPNYRGSWSVMLMRILKAPTQAMAKVRLRITLTNDQTVASEFTLQPEP